MVSVFHSLAVHLWKNKSLEYFHFGAIMNKAHMNIVYKFVCKH